MAEIIWNQGYTQNRELSWLEFNARVLAEAEDETVPLLERFKFLAIFTSNLDEFFMVRVAGLWDKWEDGINQRDASGLTVKEQLDEISASAHEQVKLQYKYMLSILKELESNGIRICRVSKISEKGRGQAGSGEQERLSCKEAPCKSSASISPPSSSFWSSWPWRCSPSGA